MSNESFTTDELAEIERQAKAMLASGKFLPMQITRLLAVLVPKLCAEVRDVRQQLAARDAQIIRMRAVIEGAETASAQP